MRIFPPSYRLSLRGADRSVLFLKLFPPRKDEQNSACDREKDEGDPSEDSKNTPWDPLRINKFMKKEHSIRVPVTIRMIPPTVLVRQAT